jgi:L-2-hydroxyglutarate oxidase LhgO
VHSSTIFWRAQLVPADREGYSKWQLRPGDFFDAVTYCGLWKFMRRHRAMAWEEVVRSFSKAKFCESLQRLVPAVQLADLEQGMTGVRAQAMLQAEQMRIAAENQRHAAEMAMKRDIERERLAADMQARQVREMDRMAGVPN